MRSDAPFDRIVETLRHRRSLPPLAPEHAWHPGLDAEIAGLSDEVMTKDRPDGRMTARAWKALLHLWNDSLEPAHAIVQELETPTGAALHGILHRREGDFGNAKYWFRTAGEHPAYFGLQAKVSEWLADPDKSGVGLPAGPAGEAIRTIARQGVWNPYLFTDAVEIAVRSVGDDAAVDILENIQLLELEAFLRYLRAWLAPAEFAD